jgi:CRISPR-associated protein Cas5d
MRNQTHVLEVWGQLACFSRPEMKVERFSYPVITPSAARGIFDAIFVKPGEFRWQVRRIEILSHPAYIPLRRNEVKEKASLSAIQKWMSGKKEPEPIWADGDRHSLGTDMKGRTQRQTMALKNVQYRLHAEIRPWSDFSGHPNGLSEQFRRRAARGQCFHQPYLGCREFPAYFRLIDETDRQPLPLGEYTQDLGLMLYDVFDLSHKGTEDSAPFISLFKARVEHGVLDVPPYESAEVLKPEGGSRDA